MLVLECYRTQSLCDVQPVGSSNSSRKFKKVGLFNLILIQTRLFNCCTKAAFYSLPVLVFKTTAIYASGKVNYLASYGIFLG